MYVIIWKFWVLFMTYSYKTPNVDHRVYNYIDFRFNIHILKKKDLEM